MNMKPEMQRAFMYHNAELTHPALFDNKGIVWNRIIKAEINQDTSESPLDLQYKFSLSSYI